MFVIMGLLFFVAIVLHLNTSAKEVEISKTSRLFRLVFCISIAIFIPSIIEYIFWNVSEYNLLLFHPVVMYVFGKFFSIGLQLMAYGKMSSPKND